MCFKKYEKKFTTESLNFLKHIYVSKIFFKIFLYTVFQYTKFDFLKHIYLLKNMKNVFGYTVQNFLKESVLKISFVNFLKFKLNLMGLIFYF